MLGTLAAVPVTERLDLVAPPVRAALEAAPGLDVIEVAPIDPALSDTAAFCAHYRVPLDASANCVVVTAKRGGETRFAACVVLATTRADVNGLVRRHLDARKCSFAPMDQAVTETGMEYGAITPIGLPAGWPVLVDTAVAAARQVVIGSGVRASKLLLPGAVLAEFPEVTVIDGLGLPASVNAGP